MRLSRWGRVADVQRDHDCKGDRAGKRGAACCVRGCDNYVVSSSRGSGEDTDNAGQRIDRHAGWQ